MNLPTSTHVGRLYVESRHLPATQGGGGDIHDVMATPFGVRLLVGDVMGTRPARQPDWPVGAERLARPGLHRAEPGRHRGPAARADRPVRAPERFVTALLVNFPVESADGGAPPAGSWAELVCCGHPPPLLVRDNSAAFIEPYAAPPARAAGPGRGVVPASMMPVGNGDQLLLYIDGVSEARAADGQFFPLAQVTADAVRGTGPDRAPLLDVLVARLDEHVGDRRCDDILLLLVTMR